MSTAPDALRDQLDIAVAKRIYNAYRHLLGSPRWQRVYNAGARPQRLVWASTGTRDPKASDILYIKARAAPFTVNTCLNLIQEHRGLGSLGPLGETPFSLEVIFVRRSLCDASTPSRKMSAIDRGIFS
jgi:hypothetical protein